jgi:hypothetical protein
VHPIDPGAGQIHQRLQVGVARQPLGLEAPDLAAGGSRVIQPVPTDDRAHDGIAGEPLGVVDALVASEPTEHRLAEQPDQLVARVPTTAPVEQFRDRHVGESEGVVEVTVGEQAAVGSDPGTVELEIDPAVENGPQGRLFGFTRRTPHDPVPRPVPTS